MKYFHYFLIVILFSSCQKDPSSPNSNQPQKKPSGIIYSMGRWKFSAFDLAQEKVLWQTDLVNITLDANTTLYDNGTLYAHTASGVIALDATTGHVKWRQQGGGVSSVGGMPVVKDSLLYSIGSNTSIWGLGSSLYCLNARTGAVVWQKPIQAEYSSELATGSPVVVGDKVIGVGHGGSSGAPRNSIYCFNRFTGSQIWYDGSTVSNVIKPFPFSPDNSQVIFPAGNTGVSTDGLYSFDVNTGAFLWHNSAMVISGRQVKINHENQLVLIAHGLTGTFNLLSKKLENIITDTIHRATVFKDKIFLTKYDYGSELKCRSIYDNKTIWEKISPYRQIWSTTSDISNSYTSSLVADEDYVYYHEYINNGPNPSLDNSLFIYNSSTGDLVKEIKLNEVDRPLNKTFFLVKDGKAYYPDMK